MIVGPVPGTCQGQSDGDVFDFFLGAGFRDAGRRKSEVGITWSGKSRSGEDPTGQRGDGLYER